MYYDNIYIITMDEQGMFDINDIGEITSVKDKISIEEATLNENLIKFNQVQLKVNSVRSY